MMLELLLTPCPSFTHIEAWQPLLRTAVRNV